MPRQHPYVRIQVHTFARMHVCTCQLHEWWLLRIFDSILDQMCLRSFVVVRDPSSRKSEIGLSLWEALFFVREGTFCTQEHWFFPCFESERRLLLVLVLQAGEPDPKLTYEGLQTLFERLHAPSVLCIVPRRTLRTLVSLLCR